MLGLVVLFLNIGTPELILIMFVALMLFGGEKLPGLARGLGKGIRDFKDASEGVKREIQNQIDNFEEKKPVGEISSNTEEPQEDTANEPEHGHEQEHETESHPLIDTTPVAGTTPIGEHHTEEHEIAEHHAAGTYNETEHSHEAKPEEPVKTTHE